jgi:hypothetical protein
MGDGGPYTNACVGDAGVDALRSIAATGLPGKVVPDPCPQAWHVAIEEENGGVLGKVGRVWFPLAVPSVSFGRSSQLSRESTGMSFTVAIPYACNATAQGIMWGALDLLLSSVLPYSTVTAGWVDHESEGASLLAYVSANRTCPCKHTYQNSLARSSHGAVQTWAQGTGGNWCSYPCASLQCACIPAVRYATCINMPLGCASSWSLLLHSQTRNFFPTLSSLNASNPGGHQPPTLTRRKPSPKWHKLTQFLTRHNTNWHKFLWTLVHQSCFLE